ncbi:hypothetical protein [Trueperella pyogenes]|uniref:hypothetical protein n=1 Tax=Trueperella pyogenes TaxID=1661 RepID=UPI00312B8B82
MDALVPAIIGLIGVLIGGIGTPFINGRIKKRQEERDLIREAQTALEKWAATRVGPGLSVKYPELEESIRKEISDQATRDYFERHFRTSYELMAALGAVRHCDKRIAKVTDSECWKPTEDDVEPLRLALSAAIRKM